MSYIYVITNNINGKQYVGQTRGTINHRFKEHITESKKNRSNYPLYRAMRKYGQDHFSIELLEEVPEEALDEKEKYWINKLNTYKNGYNATLGGSGYVPSRFGEKYTKTYDYKVIAEKYKELQNQEKVMKFFGCSRETVKRACEVCGVPVINITQMNHKKGKAINMLDKEDNLICTFDTAIDAVKGLKEQGLVKADSNSGGPRTHIREVCKGEKTFAYGYKGTGVN